MSPTSAKTKIYLALALWLLLCGSMILYFFGVLDQSNQEAVAAMASQNQELSTLRAQNDSYQRAKADLKDMSAQSLQPDNFFGRDYTLVHEIETLEGWAGQLGVKLTIAGLSGTVKGAASAGTITPLVAVPYSITLQGPLDKVADYVEVMEHLSFVTTVSSLSLSAMSGNSVNLNLNANFYLHSQ